ncbi:hypothetical protein ASG52_17470 [Methylobacterium sp. Leaf456]|uniref:hypothetical protein n=1 Tax=Methylobacterium sp. Leaf456 TaxID=1736382 RepID=UPI0006F73DF0|nr:hypothetical protein [Methylobacterium sp. Leaf456]KQT61026.1 hypothetical protein ASG52_17470 [Methylobacterium sp. Leaf456]
MISRILLGAVLGASLSTAALAQSFNAPAGIPAATAPGGLTGLAAPGNVGRFVQRRGYPERAVTTGSVRGERLR